MIDNFALAISHGLMLLAAWRLLRRVDLDQDDVAERQHFRPGRRPGVEPGVERGDA